jgi:hypothetical protein
MPSLNLLKEELLRHQHPHVGGRMYIVHCEGEVRVTWPRCPRIEGKRNLARNHIHTLADPFFCNVRMPNYFSPKGFAVRNVLLSKAWSAEFEETTKPAAFNQMERLEVWMHISIMHTQDKVILTSSSEMISSIMKSRSPAFVNAGALGSWVTTPSREVCLVIWSVFVTVGRP